MGFQVFLAFVIISSVWMSPNSAESPGEAYWRMNLGNDITMPEVVKESLLGSPKISNTRSCVIQHNLYEPTLLHNVKGSNLPMDNYVEFFLEENLARPGSNLKLLFSNGARQARFKTSKIANSIPFASNKLSEILRIFAIKPKSEIANLIEQTLWLCEHKPLKGEQKFCANSLESLVSYAKSRLGDRVNVFATEVDSDTIQEYRIESAKKIQTGKNMVCHKMNYPYAVFSCHTLSKTDVYKVSLSNYETGKKGMAMAICHKDTSPWYPGHVSFQTLKVKPGSVPICHFLHPDAILWVTK